MGDSAKANEIEDRLIDFAVRIIFESSKWRTHCQTLEQPSVSLGSYCDMGLQKLALVAAFSRGFQLVISY